MFGLLMIFGQIWGKPWYGKNSSLVQSLTTGPHHIQLAGSNLVPIPRPIAAQIHTRTALDLVEKPQRAGRRHDQPKRIGTDDALPFATLILPEPIEGVGVTDFDFHRPAVAILSHDVIDAQGQIGGEQGFEGRQWFSLPRLFRHAFAIPPEHHHTNQAPRQHRMPQPTPGLYLGTCFARVGHPSLGRLGQGFGRADHGAFFARGAPTLFLWRWRRLVELGADGETSNYMDRMGKLADIVFGGITPVGQTPEVTR